MSHTREALEDLRQDVDALRLHPPSLVRARGEARRRRVAVATATATVAVAVAAGTGATYVVRATGAAPGGSGSDTAPSCAPATSPPPKPTGPAAMPTGHHRGLRIFLDREATLAQRSAIGAVLQSSPLVARSTFVSHEDAYAQFAQNGCTPPDLVAVTRPESLMESFAVTLVDPADFEAVRDSVAGLPGVLLLVATD